jgi:BirA family biotin operon repressor/biotin-[acetyl-CoA-carboxylase] ligase
VRGFEPGSRAVPIHWFDEIDSTNAQARRLAQAGESGPLWIAARRQSAGRGRRGRTWDTAAGNLAATLLATTPLEPALAAQLSFVAAFAVRELAARYVPEALIRFKWPNDLLLAGEKLSGILIESGRRPEGDLWLAIGIGVNLASAPASVERPATSLAAHLKADVAAPPSPADALEILSASLSRRIHGWTSAGFDACRTEWLAGAAGIGAPCTARLGRETVQGVAEGLDVDGALLLRLEDRTLRRITAGDIFLEGA